MSNKNKISRAAVMAVASWSGRHEPPIEGRSEEQILFEKLLKEQMDAIATGKFDFKNND